MNAAQKFIFRWPELPPLPPPGQPVLVRIATSLSRPFARQELRNVLRQILAAWSRLPPEKLPLHETPRGPAWPGLLDTHTLDISLSYAESEGWIGLLRAGRIGLDATPVQPIPEAEAVARHYFDSSTWQTIRQSAHPAQAFAIAWTELEARLKCLKLDLNESSATSASVWKNCVVESFVQPNNIVTTIATASPEL